MNYQLFLSSVIALAIFSNNAFATVRTWTDRKGRPLNAEMISKTKDEVTLKRDDGKTFTLKINLLSDKDQKFIAEWKPKNDAGPAKPTPDTKTDPISESGIEEKHFSNPWPKLVSAESGLEIEESRGENDTYVYRSPHYEFICDAKLSMVPVKRFATLFEATKSYVQALPLGNAKAHSDNGKRYKVFLFESKANYVRAGAPAQSAGVYMPNKDIIMVPFESLGLIKAGGTYRIDYDKSNKTLPHEITHQLTNHEYFEDGSMGWYTEGLAEYIATTPYRSGKFSVNNVQGAVEEYTTGFSRSDNRGRNIGKEFKAPNLESFMNLDYGQFAGANGNFNYALSALLVTYFCHFDGEGDAANLKNFLRALAKGEDGAAAQKKLLAGRSFDELEKSIAKEWGKRGVKINFQ